MTLLDLSLVTQSLVTLVREHVKSSPAWPSGQTLNVVPQPPDKLDATNTIGIYLYHLSEDAHYKNLPPPGSDQPSIRYTPMALNLFYQVTPHHEQDSDTSTYREQLLMGLAVKALRDVPCIDDATRINGTAILHADLRGADNRIRIVLQPVPSDEAVTPWTAGSGPLRLAAYYQVSVALLEPEETMSRAGRVLTYGVHTFTRGAPRLLGSRNTLSFTIPGEAEPRTIELRPAAAPYGGQVDFLGVDLAGDETALLLKHLSWDAAVEADSAWGVAAADDRVLATVRPEASGRDILPGVYAATVRVTTRRTMPDSSVRTFANVSNATPFTIAPRIDAISAPNASGELTVDGAVFDHPDLEDDAVQVYVAESRLARSGGGALNLGEFAVASATRLEVRLPAALPSGATRPLRVLVNDAESPPRWVTVP